MEPEILLGLFLRMLPALVVVALGFVAVGDKKTRNQWNNLLYQIGSIRPDQKEDAKIGSGVKWPFFLVAIGLLIWPIQYYRHATRTIDASGSDLKIVTPRSDLNRSTPAPDAASGTTPSTAPQSDLHQVPTQPSETSRPQSDLTQPVN